MSLEPRLWLTSKEAAVYVPCKSVKAFYEWKRRHRDQLKVRINGTVSKRSLDRILNAPKPTPRMSPAQLANLTRRHQGADPIHG